MIANAIIKTTCIKLPNSKIKKPVIQKTNNKATIKYVKSFITLKIFYAKF